MSFTLLALALATQLPEPPALPAAARSVEAGVTLGATIAPGEALVGDVLTLELEALGPAGTDLGEPFAPAGLEPFVLRRVEHEPQAALADGRVRRLSRYELALYDTGRFVLPELRLDVVLAGGEPRALAMPAIGVLVRSIVPAGDEAALRDLRAARWLPQRLSWWVVALAVALSVAVALALAALVARRARRPEAPPLPPDATALAALAALRREGPAAPAKLFYVRVTDIVKGYLGARYGFEALGETSEELVRGLDARAVPAAARTQIGSLLRDADLVKFAAHAPPPADRLRALDLAVSVVTATRPAPEPQQRRVAT